MTAAQTMSGGEEGESGLGGTAIALICVGVGFLLALVAGRLSRKPPKERAAKVHGERLVRDAPVIYPSYWTSNVDGVSNAPIHEFVHDEGAKEDLQNLLDSTFVQPGGGREQTSGKAKGRLLVQEVRRVENSEMWRLYMQSLAWIRQARQVGPDFREAQDTRGLGSDPLDAVVPSSAPQGSGTASADAENSSQHKLSMEDPPRTLDALSPKLRLRLQDDVNEAYLFHGTSRAAAEAIGETDFRIDLAGHTHGKKLGHGAYFAEASSLAHSYAPAGPDGVFAILIVRVLLGHVFVSDSRSYAWSVKKRDFASAKHMVASGKWDSILGDREKVAHTFREFCVADKAQLYPEYLVLCTFDGEGETAP